MIEDFTLNLLAGGCAECGASWKDRNPNHDQCYKFYLPIQGRACVFDGMECHAIEPGFLYFISGYQLKSQECPSGMKVHWLHFTPASFYLHRHLLQAPCLHAWPVADVPWAKQVMENVSQLFENATSLNMSENNPDIKSPVSLLCRTEAMMMYLVADILDAFCRMKDDEPGSGMARLRRAINYMDSHYFQNPSPSTLAEMVQMTPNVFQRMFRIQMGTTPCNYMNARRLDQARRLLANPNARIKEVAAACGYTDPLYFSRVFTRHYGMRPSEAKRTGAKNP